MINAPAVLRREGLRLIGSCVILLVLAAILGTGVNFFRPAATQLPWVGDWDEHIETRAFNAGVPVLFLMAARDRVRTGTDILLDARPIEQYRTGHLPGARPMPLDAVDEHLAAYASVLSMDTPIWIYCSGEDCADSLDLVLMLRTYGFSDLTLYPGGYAEWTAYGGEIQTGDTP
jgi:rhodanese-related sulfurtransferase